MGGAVAVAVVANATLPLKCAVTYYGGPAYITKILGDGFASRLHAPQLFYWAGRDAHLDAASRGALVEAVRKAGKRFVAVEFSFADHGFNCDARAIYDAEAAAESWALTLSFLRRHLS